MKIMVLAGGNDQIALIKELRDYFHNNVEIVLIDQNSNVRAKEFADKFFPISTMNRELVLETAKKERIDYILTACGDQPLSTMVYVSEKLNLPCYLTMENVQNLTNKLYMKRIMRENDIPTAKYVCVSESYEKLSFQSLVYPLVVKPVDSNGSKGVKKVFSEADLNDSITEALRYSLSGDVVVEEYQEGEELSVDVYVEDGVAKILSVTSSKKIKQNETSFTILQSLYPALAVYDEERVSEIVQKIANVFCLKNTPLLVQMIVKDGRYSVIEFSARMGGGSKYRLIEVLSGVDIMKVYVEMIMGKTPRVTPRKMVDCAIMSYIYCSEGVFCKLNNIDLLIREREIDDCFIYKMPGTFVEKSETSSDRVAGFLVTGRNMEEVKQKLRNVNMKLQVLDEMGKDIMRHELYE